ncbi:MAG: Smr/MutS family protein [Burkholderiaceae bacterium]
MPADLSSLSRLRDALKAEQLAREEAAQRERQERAQAERERNLFRTAVGEVEPVRARGRQPITVEPPSPRARQFEQDESRALAASMSDEIDIERLLDTDGDLSYRRPGVGADVVRRLRKGHWSLQSQIDLHGLRVDEAREALAAYLAQCVKRELRCVRVVHGKGLGSVNREPVLKGKVLKWLTQRDEVLAFCQAPPVDGGSGALLVLLKPPS